MKDLLSTITRVGNDFRPGGLLVPLVTPYGADAGVDLTSLRSLTTDVIRQGADGIVALGTTGEPHLLDDAERASVVATIAEVCEDLGAALVVGAGSVDTRTTIAVHERLADVPGARASLTVVPYYIRPSESAIVRHFQAVAQRSPVPVIAYNIPYRTGVGLGSAALLELAATDNVVGVKQAVGGIDADTLTLLSEAPERFAVLAGDDAFILPLTLMGGTGAIAASAHVCTDRFAEMVACGCRGDVECGRRQAKALLRLILALFAEPSPALIKAALHLEGRIPTPDVRMPLSSASLHAVECVRRELAAVGPTHAI